MTNKADLTAGWVTDDLRLYEIATCEDADDHVVGIKFTLKGDGSVGPPAMLVMDNLGDLVNCQEFRPGSMLLDKVEAQWN